jgi:hypothetical protein
MSTRTELAPRDQTAAPKPSRTIRVIHRESFGVSDRGEEWGWSASATWWHQRWGVKGFHKRILFGAWSKTEFPEPPTIDDIVAIYNESSNYTWEVSA